MSSEAQTGSQTPSKILTEVQGQVLRIAINRPEKKNAFDLSMIGDLSKALHRLEDDTRLRCGVIHARGDCFTAGLDLGRVAPTVAQGDGRWLPEDAIDPLAAHGRACAKPIVCAVHGLCLTIGIELMLACDIVVASSDARFAQIEIKRGIFPFGGGTYRWVAAAGWGNSMRYLLTGDEFEASEALRIGLVQEVVEPDRLLPRAIGIAETVSAQAPLGVQATLRSSRLALSEGPGRAFRELIPEVQRLMKSEDAQEGLASFLERRTARFQGR